MIFLEKLRTKAGCALLKHKSGNRRRNVKAVSLKRARTVGIVFDAGNSDNLKLVKNFIKDFPASGAQFTILGYLPDAKKEHNYISDKTWQFFSQKECNFFMEPKLEILSEFTNRKLDLLLVLDTHYHFPVKWLTRMSMASFKAGISNVYDEEFDFMIEMKDRSMAQLIEQLMHYLGDLNTADE